LGVAQSQKQNTHVPEKSFFVKSGLTAQLGLIILKLKYFYFQKILKGLFLNDFETQTTYFGHLATIFLIISLLANIMGFTIFTVPILMILGIYLFQKRMI
jgi:hypothetical protein